MIHPHFDYKSSGVNYNLVDPFKRFAQKVGKKTIGKHIYQKISEVAASRGESAYVWEEKNCYRAQVMEGLGTKNLIADAMRTVTGKTYYDAIAQDTVAMIINDLISVGARPQVVTAYFAVGDSRWFADRRRANDLINGWAKACVLSAAVWGGGETPILKGIIARESIDLAGSASGIIQPKKHLLLGDHICDGDAIVLVQSSGIHANGLTLARSVAAKLPKGYATTIFGRLMFGEALLTPTYIYARFVESLFLAGVALHYLVNITGHGWRKLMRANRKFTYTIDTIMPVPFLFQFLQQNTLLNDREMYATFNMGAGLALYISEMDVVQAIAIAKRHGFHAWKAGYITEGKREVVIKPKRIVFTSETLKIRD